ncbi:ATP-binding protein [Pontibacter sp. G13]|uniref:sensor histidine kinase n=1 Tax=Pontibacter sp. G13 TaxID=3074898 RepID=UPI0028898A4B|nr:ATP-binding protein [Pontibacter sp. G13]WNJ16638.1 ATP-binding protein [Pontibacter sp. G13]
MDSAHPSKETRAKDMFEAYLPAMAVLSQDGIVLYGTPAFWTFWNAHHSDYPLSDILPAQITSFIQHALLTYFPDPGHWEGRHLSTGGQSPHPYVQCKLSITQHEGKEQFLLTCQPDHAVERTSVPNFREMVTRLDDFLYIVDVQSGKLVYDNSDGYFLGHNFRETDSLMELATSLVHDQDVSELLSARRRLKPLDAGIETTEFRILDESGNCRWFLCKEQAFTRSEDGKLKQVLGFMSEITDQKNAETQLNKQYYETRYILDSMPVMFMQKDLSNNILKVNMRVAENLDLPIEEIEGRPSRELYPEDSDKYYEDDKRLMRTGMPVLGIVERHQSSTGDQWVRTDKLPFYDEDGEIKGILLFATDVTNLVKTERELRRKNEELERYIQSNSELEQYAYVASHDLREPLRTLTGFSQLLKRKYGEELDQTATEYLELIIRSAKNMDRLIRDLLSFARLDGGVPQFEYFDTLELQEQILSGLGRQIRETDAEVLFEAFPKQLYGQPLRIKQLFQNLISNAIKYRHPDRSPEVHIQCDMLPDGWDITVTDNGLGIPEEQQDAVFELFKHFNPKPGQNSAGIGLALCKKIVQQHQGRITLSSLVGQGTCIRLFLPGTSFTSPK